jgi:hypothetical protein
MKNVSEKKTKLKPEAIWKLAETAAELKAISANIPVMSLPCGFAWVTIFGKSSFLTWCKSHKYATTDIKKGYVVKWVAEYNQNYTLKSIYANEFAATLRKHGINAIAFSSLD